MFSIKSYNTNQDILVDGEDYSSLSTYNWSINPKGYAWSKIDGKTTYMARLIMNCDKGLTVDHINHNTLDNRKENLRICTYSQNNYNRRIGRINSASKYKGVRKSDINGKWQTEIINNEGNIFIGAFYTEDYSALMYNKNVLDVQGEYGYFNILDLSEEDIINNEKIAEQKHFEKINKYSKYRYVSFNKTNNMWFGQKFINGKNIRTSHYNNEEDARDEILKIIKEKEEV